MVAIAPNVVHSQSDPTVFAPVMLGADCSGRATEGLRVAVEVDGGGAGLPLQSGGVAARAPGASVDSSSTVDGACASACESSPTIELPEVSALEIAQAHEAAERILCTLDPDCPWAALLTISDGRSCPDETFVAVALMASGGDLASHPGGQACSPWRTISPPWSTTSPTRSVSRSEGDQRGLQCRGGPCGDSTGAGMVSELEQDCDFEIPVGTELVGRIAAPPSSQRAAIGYIERDFVLAEAVLGDTPLHSWRVIASDPQARVSAGSSAALAGHTHCAEPAGPEGLDIVSSHAGAGANDINLRDAG